MARFHLVVAGSGGSDDSAPDPFATLRERLDAREAPPTSHSRIASDWDEIRLLRSRLSAANQAARGLLQTLPDRADKLQPIHGDARPEHFLVTRGELTGLIDFEAMRLGLPEEDLARFAGEIAGGDAACRDRLVAIYAEAAGKPIDPRRIAALDGVKATIAAANWLGWLSEPGFGLQEPGLVRSRLRSILTRLPDRPRGS